MAGTLARLAKVEKKDGDRERDEGKTCHPPRPCHKEPITIGQVDHGIGSGRAASRDLHEPIEDPQSFVVADILLGLRDQNVGLQEVGWLIRRGRKRITVRVQGAER